MLLSLADTAIRGEDLDEAKAAEAKKRAEEALADKSDKYRCRKGISGACSSSRAAENDRKFKKKKLNKPQIDSFSA